MNTWNSQDARRINSRNFRRRSELSAANFNNLLGDIGLSHSNRPAKIPTAFSHAEAIQVIKCLQKRYRLSTELLGETDLRITECVQLRVKYIDFSHHRIIVREGQNGQNRITVFPECLIPKLAHQISVVETTLALDRESKVGSVWLLNALKRKYPSADFQMGWQFLFSSCSIATAPKADVMQRFECTVVIFV